MYYYLHIIDNTMLAQWVVFMYQEFICAYICINVTVIKKKGAIYLRDSKGYEWEKREWEKGKWK